MVEAELDTGAAARRLRKDIAEVYGHPADVVDGRRATASARAAATSCGWSRTARRWPGRPACSTAAGVRCGVCRPQVVSGGGCDAVAAWRGAFLAHGSLTEPGRSSALEVTCPGPEAALALVGRPAGSASRPRPARSAASTGWSSATATRSARCSTRLGAHESLMAWEERRMRREVRATANRLANFDDANLRRSARAAVAAGARVERALEILGDEVPDHLQAWPATCASSTSRRPSRSSAQLHDPPLTKDAIAGRIRRLLAMADKRAEELGIPDTEASLTPEMLADEA